MIASSTEGPALTKYSSPSPVPGANLEVNYFFSDEFNLEIECAGLLLLECVPEALVTCFIFGSNPVLPALTVLPVLYCLFAFGVF